MAPGIPPSPVRAPNNSDVEVVVDREPAAEAERVNPGLYTVSLEAPLMQRTVNALRDHQAIVLPALLAPQIYHLSPLWTGISAGAQPLSNSALFNHQNLNVGYRSNRAIRGLVPVLRDLLSGAVVNDMAPIRAHAKPVMDQLVVEIEKYYQQRGIQLPSESRQYANRYRQIVKSVVYSVTSGVVRWSAAGNPRTPHELARIIFTNCIEIIEASGIRAHFGVWLEGTRDSSVLWQELYAVIAGEKPPAEIMAARAEEYRIKLARYGAQGLHHMQNMPIAGPAGAEHLAEVAGEEFQKMHGTAKILDFIEQAQAGFDPQKIAKSFARELDALKARREGLANWKILDDFNQSSPVELPTPAQQAERQAALRMIDQEIRAAEAMLRDIKSGKVGPFGGLNKISEMKVLGTYDGAAWKRVAKMGAAGTLMGVIPVVGFIASAEGTRKTLQNPRADKLEKGASVVRTAAASGLVVDSASYLFGVNRGLSKAVLPLAIVMESADTVDKVKKDLRKDGSKPTRIALDLAQGGSGACLISAMYFAEVPQVFLAMLAGCGSTYVGSGHVHDIVVSTDVTTTLMKEIAKVRAQTRIPGGEPDYDAMNAEFLKVLVDGDFSPKTALKILKAFGGRDYGNAIDWKNDPAVQTFLDCAFHVFWTKAHEALWKGSFSESDAAALLFFGFHSQSNGDKVVAIRKFFAIAPQNREQVWQNFVREMKLDPQKYADLESFYRQNISFELDRDLRLEGFEWKLNTPISSPPSKVQWENPEAAQY